MDHWQPGPVTNQWNFWERPLPRRDGETEQLHLASLGQSQATSAISFPTLQQDQGQSSRPATGHLSGLISPLLPVPLATPSNDSMAMPPPALPQTEPSGVVNHTQKASSHATAGTLRKRRKPPSEADWEQQKSRIEEMYMKQNLSLTQTIRRMEQDHQFSASDKQYKDRFKFWKWSKYLSRGKASWMMQKAEERQPHPTVFQYGNQVWTEERIRRTFDRTMPEDTPGDQVEMGISALDMSTPNGITYGTPSVVTSDTPLASHPPHSALSPRPWTPSQRPHSKEAPEDGFIRFNWRNLSLVDLDKLVVDASKADAKGSIAEAEDKFLTAVEGFQSLLSPTDQRTARAAYLLAAFYANHRRMGQADNVINWLTSKIVERWGLRNKTTLLHFVRVVELLQFWDRYEHARVVIYKLLDDWNEFEDDEPFNIPSSNSGVVMDPPGNLEEIQESIFEESSDGDQVNLQLQIANLWLSSGTSGMDVILPRLISQCERYPKELQIQTIQARCSLAQLQITQERHEEARSVLQIARSSLESHLKRQNKVSKPILDLSSRLAFLHFQMGDKRVCKGILELAARIMEGLTLKPAPEELVLTAIHFMVSVGVEYHERVSWKQASPWLERALALSINTLGRFHSTTAKLERALQEKRFQPSSFGEVDELIKSRLDTVVVRFS